MHAVGGLDFLQRIDMRWLKDQLGLIVYHKMQFTIMPLIAHTVDARISLEFLKR